MIPDPRHAGRRHLFRYQPSPDSPSCSNIPSFMQMASVWQRSGGFKLIKRKLGIVRPDHLREVDGFEAVRLWSEHRRGKSGTLEKLLDYCRRDVINMKPLMDRVAQEMPNLVGLPSALLSNKRMSISAKSGFFAIEVR